MRASHAIAIVACAAGCGVHRTTPVPISFGPNRELIVDASIDGKPLRLQLDTGASTTSLTPATTERLGITALTTFLGTRGEGVAGHIGKVQVIRLFHTRVCGHLVRYLPGAIVDIDSAHGSIDGVLGMDVMGQYAADIDLDKNQVALHRKDDDAWRRSADLVGIAYAVTGAGHIIVDAMLDGRAVKAIIDLGANRSFANPAAAPPSDDTVRVVTAAVGADGHAATFRTIPHVPVTVGGVPLVVPSLLVAPLPIFRRLVGDGPAMIIGADVLDGRRIVIDPEDQRVYLSRR